MISNSFNSKISNMQHKRRTQEIPPQKKGEKTAGTFDDGFAKSSLERPRLYRSDELPEELRKKFEESRASIRKKEISGDELIANSQPMDIFKITPTQCAKTLYQVTIDYDNSMTDITTGGRIQGEAFSVTIIDRTRDEDCPGRCFINGKDFFWQSADLYASDKNYLDHNRAWMPREIKRYAQDVARFFETDVDNTAPLEQQISDYIRIKAGSPQETDGIMFDIGGVEFSGLDFEKTVAFLNSTLLNAGEKGLSADKTAGQIQEFGDANLNEDQTALLLGTKEKWSTYSDWAAIYGHDAGIFQYC